MKEHDAIPLSDFIEYDENEMLQRSADFYQNIKRRHSIRMFSDKSVPQSIIENCIKAAGTAPSGANHQPWHFVAVQNPDVKQQIRQQAEAHEQAFYAGRAGEEWLKALKDLGTDAQKPYLEHAPWLIAIFSEKKGGIKAQDKQTNYYVHESVGIATGILITALHNAGLATLTHTPKPMSFLNKICQRSDNDRAYMLLVIGYPAQNATIPKHAQMKKPLNDIATFL
ncbi:nitroreductase family protein [Thalassotalea sp. PLHSN55]|uniref:nitroreductase family protein n=1 Tax=Thalassotalea sp. PLHSN55 TaxID=3435888 RepID=UPI003F84CB92